MLYTLFLILGGVFEAIGWIVFIGMFIGFSANGGGTLENVYINGTLVENTSISIYVLLLIPLVFIIVGLPFAIIGLKGKAKQRKLKNDGVETIGLITNLYPSGVIVNEKPELKVDICIVENDIIKTCNGTVGFDWSAYTIGEYVAIQYYEDMANVIGAVSEQAVPYEIKQALSQRAERVRKNCGYYNMSNICANSTSDEIVVNGIRYRKEE